jgi:ABC-type oligopeptide transport system substrate-binding subunit
MRKFIIAATALAALAVPAASMADAPNGTFVNNTTEQATTNPNASQLGQQSSQIKQNGQFEVAWFGTNRGAVVQSILHP